MNCGATWRLVNVSKHFDWKVGQRGWQCHVTLECCILKIMDMDVRVILHISKSREHLRSPLHVQGYYLAHSTTVQTLSGVRWADESSDTLTFKIYYAFHGQLAS